MITEMFLPTKGGTPVWFDEAYRRMGGKEVHIVTADVAGAAEFDKTHPNTIHRLSLKRYEWLKPESLLMYMRMLWTTLRIAIKHEIVAVHAGRVLPEGLIGWIIARLFNVPIIVYAHGEEITTWRQPGKFKVMRFVYRRVDRIIANSEFTQQELLKLGVDSGRIILISPGVDISRFKSGLEFQDLRASLGLSENQQLVLSVGRLSRRKGFDQMLRATARCLAEGQDFHYAIIGIGEDVDYLSDLVKELGIGERVHMLGHVAMDDLPRWYNAADIFAMPNREINGDTEGFGMVFIEASACGKPVLAGEAGGTGAAVIDHQTGLRVDGASLEAVTQALKRLLSDKDFAGQLGAEGLARVRREFSWEAVVDKTKRLYDLSR